MERISFLNGQFLPHSQCFVHIEDRGLQMADGIYEVVLLQNNKLIDFDWHFERLLRSLREFQIKFEIEKAQLEKTMLDLFAKNNLQQGSIYLQITRGTSPRYQGLPANYTPTVIATVSPLKNTGNLKTGLNVITHQDLRWQRCDIKSTALFASSLVRQKAFDAGCDDAIFIRDGFVTEATFANVFIVDQNNDLITHPADNFVLCGITRNRIIELAKANNIKVLQQKFTTQQLLNAREIFLSSSTLLLRPVGKVDNQIIGDGNIGKISENLLSLYNNFIGS